MRTKKELKSWIERLVRAHDCRFPYYQLREAYLAGSTPLLHMPLSPETVDEILGEAEKVLDPWSMSCISAEYSDVLGNTVRYFNPRVVEVEGGMTGQVTVEIDYVASYTHDYDERSIDENKVTDWRDYLGEKLEAVL